jgi:hypothetical protein
MKHAKETARLPADHAHSGPASTQVSRPWYATCRDINQVRASRRRSMGVHFGEARQTVVRPVGLLVAGSGGPALTLRSGGRN